MSPDHSILAVDDDPANIARIRQALDPLGANFEVASNGLEALDALSRLSGPQGFPGIVITDLKMPAMDGLEFLGRAIRADPDLPVILVSAYGEIASAVRAMKTGAYDFIERPFEVNDLLAKVGRALEKRKLVLDNRRLRAELADRTGIASRLIGNSPAMRALRDEIVNIGGTDATVLVQGETGTGKEVVAHALHECSHRSRSRFVAINGGGLSENLIDSELFGHEAGAFSEARQRRIGLVEYAEGGTLFLDEIESMPLKLQVKLLRMLQERVISRLGSNEEIKVEVRVIAATKSDLVDAAKRGAFREDLYFRLGVAKLRVPTLNDRREDIPLLFEHFTSEFSARHQREIPKLSSEDLERLASHDWRGNVRELRNIAERFVLAREHEPNGIARLLDPEPTDAAAADLSHPGETTRHKEPNKLREHFEHHLTGWVVGGALLAVTGLTPEHVIAGLFEALNIRAPSFDIRIALVLIGVGVVTGDVIRRAYRDRLRPRAVTNSDSTSRTTPTKRWSRPLWLKADAVGKTLHAFAKNTKYRLLTAIASLLAASKRLISRAFR